MSRQGYLSFGHLSGTRVRLHWTVAVGALSFALLSPEPLSWLIYLGVLGVHELGHALVVQQLGFGLLAVELTAIGGHCRFRGDPDPVERAWIAWGGALGQAVLLAVSVCAGLLANQAGLSRTAAVLGSLVELNAWILVINLLPARPLDGADAWRLFPAAKAKGWPLSRTLLLPLLRWAERRRARRLGEAAQTGEMSEPLREGQEVADPDPVPAPSPEAQRELAALFERIANEAAKARRRE